MMSKKFVHPASRHVITNIITAMKVGTGRLRLSAIAFNSMKHFDGYSRRKMARVGYSLAKYKKRTKLEGVELYLSYTRHKGVSDVRF